VEVIVSFPGSAWERIAPEALPREAEPRMQWASRAEPGNQSQFFCQTLKNAV
jgi:hypothetical protein